MIKTNKTNKTKIIGIIIKLKIQISILKIHLIVQVNLLIKQLKKIKMIKTIVIVKVLLALLLLLLHGVH